MEIMHPLFAFIRRVDDTNPKFQKLCSLIKRLTPREKVVVWEGSPDIIKSLSEYFNDKGIKNLYICGEVEKSSRAGIIKEFKDTPDIRILFVSYHTSREAWEISSSSEIKRMIYYSLPDSAIGYDQSTDRLHRINSEEPVTLYRLFIKNTIDEWSKELIHQNDYEEVERQSFDRYFGIKKKKKS
jgi:superfamily II DNA/RNA helicase